MATTSWLFVTFGEGCRNVFMFQLVMWLEHFSVISPKNLGSPGTAVMGRKI
jgi:hypothetical protein